MRRRENSRRSQRNDLVEFVDNSQYFGYVNKVHVGIGKISLNLVDVDVLAKAIGRWYAIGIAKRELYQNRNIKSTTLQLSSIKTHGKKKKIGSSRGYANNFSHHENKAPFELNFSIEEIEIQLESLSSKLNEEVRTNTTLRDQEPDNSKKRAYNICILGIHAQHKKNSPSNLTYCCTAADTNFPCILPSTLDQYDI